MRPQASSRASPPASKPSPRSSSASVRRGSSRSSRSGTIGHHVELALKGSKFSSVRRLNFREQCGRRLFSSKNCSHRRLVARFKRDRSVFISFLHFSHELLDFRFANRWRAP